MGPENRSAGLQSWRHDRWPTLPTSHQGGPGHLSQLHRASWLTLPGDGAAGSWAFRRLAFPGLRPTGRASAALVSQAGESPPAAQQLSGLKNEMGREIYKLRVLKNLFVG